MGLTSGKYDVDAWETLKIAIKKRMQQELKLSTSLRKNDVLFQASKVISVLSKRKTNVLRMADIEKSF